MATIKEIASACGLSMITVSRALRDGVGVSRETRQRVLAYAKEAGYRPNLMAQNLRNGKTYLAAAIISNYADEFVGGMLKGVQKELHTHDYEVMTLEWGADETEETAERIVQTLLGRNVEGILMARWGHNRETRFFDAVVRQRIPMVALDREPSLPGLPFVGTNDREAACVATEYLISKGHKRIGHVSGPLDSSPGKERLLGFYEAMAKHHLRVNSNWVFEGDWRYQRSEQKTAQCFFSSCEQLPTAIFAASDLLAASLIQIATRRGVRVPEDLSVIGFTDERIAQMMIPPITTMHQSPSEIGREGAKLLVRMINANGKSELEELQEERILVRARLVERESVKDVRTDEKESGKSALSGTDALH